MLAWLSVWSEVQTCIWPSGFHCHSLSLASVKSRLVLPFWYRLTRVFPDKKAVKRVCVCVCVLAIWYYDSQFVTWHHRIIVLVFAVKYWILHFGAAATAYYFRFYLTSSLFQSYSSVDHFLQNRPWFLQASCPCTLPTDSIKALKETPELSTLIQFVLIACL